MSDAAAALADDHAHHGPEHDYHLVDPSPWPLLTAFAALITAIMLVVTFQNKGGVYTGFAGPIWSDHHDQQLSAANRSILDKANDFA